jgi:UDP-2,4-diacetamido-2,4,6-trideoxy-beta-L-altropyranose hydrolase
MRVVFRVECEPNIGLGHIMRCMALAQGLTRLGHQVIFIMSSVSQQFCQNRTDWLGQIIPLETVVSIDEANSIKQQCVLLEADWLILDGYQFDQDYRQTLHSDHYKFAIFDDMNNSGNLFADLVINGAHNALQLNYQTTAPYGHLAVGKGYQVLRQEFLQVTDKSWSGRKHLTLMFGGSDPYNMTLLVLQSLAKSKASMPLVVITGAAYSSLNELKRFLSTCDLDITHHHDCQNMASVLVNSRLALSAAGGSQFELLACATPAILVVVADNQKFASQQAALQGWCLVHNNENLSADELVNNCLDLWQQADSLHNMHQKALQQTIPDGAKNIAELMLKLRLQLTSSGENV